MSRRPAILFALLVWLPSTVFALEPCPAETRKEHCPPPPKEYLVTVVATFAAIEAACREGDPIHSDLYRLGLETTIRNNGPLAIQATQDSTFSNALEETKKYTARMGRGELLRECAGLLIKGVEAKR